jgi:hypothetical protein
LNEGELFMRKLLLVGLIAAAPMAFVPSSASAWGCGYGYAPRYYGYTAPRYYGYNYSAPRWRFYGARTYGWRAGLGARRWGWGGRRRW